MHHFAFWVKALPVTSRQSLGSAQTLLHLPSASPFNVVELWCNQCSSSAFVAFLAMLWRCAGLQHWSWSPRQRVTFGTRTGTKATPLPRRSRAGEGSAGDGDLTGDASPTGRSIASEWGQVHPFRVTLPANLNPTPSVLRSRCQVRRFPYPHDARSW